MNAEKSLMSIKDDIVFVQKHTETEHVLPSVEQDTEAAAAESDEVDHHYQPTASSCSDVDVLMDQPTQTDERRCRSSAADYQLDGSQVVTAQLPVSPLHSEDGEVADISLATTNCVPSSSDPDRLKANCSNHEPLTYCDAPRSNRLRRGKSDMKCFFEILCVWNLV